MVLKFKLLGLATALAVAVVAVTAHLLGEPGNDTSASGMTPVASTGSSIAPTATTSPATPEAPRPIQKTSSAYHVTANSLEMSRDLRSIYEQYKASSDVAERYSAYRAWMACFPTFVAPNGQLVSVQALTHALPVGGKKNVELENAYRAMQSRCLSFSKMSREDIAEATLHQHEANNRGVLVSPGERAELFLADGNKEAALDILRSAVSNGDPYAISSMREFVNQFINLQIDAQSVHSNERPDLRSLAFTLAACQLGLECGPDSLSALQLCTSLGECSGSVTDRYLQALPTHADREAVTTETRKVINAIKSRDFNALGLK